MLKIVLPFVAGAIVLLAFGVTAAWHVVRLQDAAADILALNVSSIRAAEELEIAIRETRYRLNQYLLTGEVQHLDQAVALCETTQHWIAEAKRLASTPEERPLINQVEVGFARFRNESQQLIRSVRNEREAASVAEGSPETIAIVQRLTGDLLPDEILRPAREYLDYNEQQLASSSKSSQADADRLVSGLLILGISGAVSGLFIGYGLARGISRSIMQLSIPVRDVAGQLDDVVGPLTLSADPQIEDLEQILHTVSERVATVITQLEHSQRAMLRSEQLASLGQFSAGLAHELRNPLMSMKLLVEAALEHGDFAALDGRDLAIVDEEIRRLEQLVQGFLDFARPPEAEPRPVLLKNLIGSSVELVLPQASRRGVRIRQLVSDSPDEMMVDPGQLRQVVINLLLNAVEHSPPDGEVIIAAVSSQTEVTIRVADNGPGIPDELTESIFEPFVSTRETGLGLGLSICRRIVETHGGTIAGRNRASGGAEFVVTLPLSSPPSLFMSSSRMVAVTVES
jgi:two-component system sensor histidine kinase HydH